MINFLKSRQIDPSAIDGYAEVLDLQKVNNSLKHSHKLNQEIQQIPEFVKSDYFEASTIRTFYSRVKTAVKQFLTLLADRIYEELYSFDEAKLLALADSFVLRMDKETASRFSQLVLSKYR